MPNADSHAFQAELALLKEQVHSQLEALRLEVNAAIEQLAAKQEGPVSAGGLAPIRARALEWERRETQLVETIAARTAEFQALRARVDLDRHRSQALIVDLEKLLALRDAENARLKTILDALLSEHAECSRNLRVPAEPGPADQANFEALKAQLENSELECASLRHAMESSLALKLARSAPRLLSPLRALLSKPPKSQGEKS